MSCGILVPDQVSNLCPLQWKFRVWTKGPREKFLKAIGSCVLDTCTQSLSLCLTFSYPPCDFFPRNCFSGFPRFPEPSPTWLTPPHGPPVGLFSSQSVWFVPGRGLWQLPLGFPLKYLLSEQVKKWSLGCKAGGKLRFRSHFGVISFPGYQTLIRVQHRLHLNFGWLLLSPLYSRKQASA